MAPPAYASIAIAEVRYDTDSPALRTEDGADAIFDESVASGLDPTADASLVLGVHAIDPPVGSGGLAVGSLIGYAILPAGTSEDLVVPIVPAGGTTLEPDQVFPPNPDAPTESGSETQVRLAVWDRITVRTDGTVATDGTPVTSVEATITGRLDQTSAGPEPRANDREVPLVYDPIADRFRPVGPEGDAIDGRIRNAETSEPLSWAVVQADVDDGTEFPPVEADGTFSLTTTRPEVDLEIVASGYEGESLTATPSPDPLTIELAPSSFSTGEVENTYDDLPGELPQDPPEERQFPPDEINEATIENGDVGARLDVRGLGSVPELVGISRDQRPFFGTEAIETASASDVVSVRNETDIDTAELTIEYDPAAVPDAAGSLAIHEYDETFQTFVSLGSAVDTVANTVTARIDDGGQFAVLDPNQWANELRSTTPRPLEEDGTVRADSPDTKRLFGVDADGGRG